MALPLSADEIVKKIESSWVTMQAVHGHSALDNYVQWLSQNWTRLSDGDRQMLIDGGAVLFDAKMRSW